MLKRELTPAEKAAAERIAAALSSCGKSQEAIGAEVGVTQGQIWQWANGRLPVPAERARDLAAALNTRPAEISPAYVAIVGDDLPPTSYSVQERAPRHYLRPDQRAILGLWEDLDADARKALQAAGHAMAKPRVKRMRGKRA